MTDVLHIDGETRSPVDLIKAGLYVYFDDPDTDVWCVCYAMNNGEVGLWVPGMPVPPMIAAHIAMGGICIAHNAAFERIMFIKILGPRYGWPVPDLNQWRCTMAQCLAMAMPAALDDACRVVGAKHKKDAAGSRLMKQMAKPRKPRKDEDPTKLYWWDDEDRKRRLFAYCADDVRAERSLDALILPLRDEEQDLWCLDQIINDRGVAIDLALVTSAIGLVEQGKTVLDREMRKVTVGEVSSTSAINELKAWLRDWHGIDCSDGLAKDRIAELLIHADLPDTARKALELRSEGSKLSVTKAEALLRSTQADGRARGLLQYHAANTGRWGGRRFQPQNLKRPVIKDIETAIRLIKTGDYQLVAAAYDNVLGVIGDTIRGMVCAGPGNVLFDADYSNIEGRVLAWLAGEIWKIRAFEAFDRGEGHDLYNITASGIIGKAVELIDDDERQGYGKVPELALGYQGGVGAFQTMAAGYGVDTGAKYDDLMASVAETVIERAEYNWSSWGSRTGIAEHDWLSAEMIKLAWRERHPKTVEFWTDMEDAAKAAINNPGSKFTVGKIAFVKNGSTLQMILPSGRALTYMFPSLKMKKTIWTDADEKPVYKLTICYWAVDSNNYQWCEHTTYGGKLVENACQAVARDILAGALFALETVGFKTVLTIHDEVVVEMPSSFGPNDLSTFERVMRAPRKWAQGLPIFAKGWIGPRFKKA